MPGFTEIVIVLIVVLLIFGPSKIPQLGDAIGKGIKNFKRATTQDDAIDVTPENKSGSHLGSGGASGQNSSAGSTTTDTKK